MFVAAPSGRSKGISFPSLICAKIITLAPGIPSPVFLSVTLPAIFPVVPANANWPPNSKSTKSKQLHLAQYFIRFSSVNFSCSSRRFTSLGSVQTRRFQRRLDLLQNLLVHRNRQRLPQHLKLFLQLTLLINRKQILLNLRP